MARRPSVVVFDVNETLSDMAPMAQRFEQVGASGSLAATWFASVLRDGFAVTVGGGFASFRDLALANLRALLPPGPDRDAAAEHVLAGMLELDVHPDVPGGLRRLSEEGVTLVTLTNGSVAVTEALLTRAGLLDLVPYRLDVAAVRRWKPAAEPYLHAAEVAGVAAESAALVAVHPWDTDGAQRAGMTGAWLARGNPPWPEPFTPPDVRAPDLESLAEALLQL